MGDVGATRPAVGALAKGLDGLCDVALADVLIVRHDTRQRMEKMLGRWDGWQRSDREAAGRFRGLKTTNRFDCERLACAGI